MTPRQHRVPARRSRRASRNRRHSPLPRPRPARELHHARRGAAARPRDHRDLRRRLRARARRRQPARRRTCCSTTARSSSAPSRTGSSTSPCSSAPARSCRSPSPASSRAAGPARSVAFDSATHISHAHLRRRKAEMLAARPLARGVAQSEVWDEIGDKQLRMSVALPHRRHRDTFDAHGDRLRSSRTRSRSSRASAAPCSRSASDLCLDPSPAPTPSRSCGRNCEPATCSTRLSGSTSSPTDGERIAGFVDEIADARVTRGPSAGLGEDVRLRGPGVIGSGLELDGERIQLSAFTSDGGGSRAFGRIARPSRRC